MLRILIQKNQTIIFLDHFCIFHKAAAKDLFPLLSNSLIRKTSMTFLLEFKANEKPLTREISWFPMSNENFIT